MGRQGSFYRLCNTAKQMRDNAIELSMMDFKYHFYPWFVDPEYVLTDVIPRSR